MALKKILTIQTNKPKGSNTKMPPMTVVTKNFCNLFRKIFPFIIFLLILTLKRKKVQLGCLKGNFLSDIFYFHLISLELKIYKRNHF